MRHTVAILTLLCLGACVDHDPNSADVEQAKLITLGCSQSTLRRSALGVVLQQFGGYREECYEIRLAGGAIGYECGQHEAYVPDRDRPGYMKAIDRFYTRVIPIGPTLSTTVQLQFDQCGVGRAGERGYGVREPSDGECYQAGLVTCKCGQGCSVRWFWD